MAYEWVKDALHLGLGFTEKRAASLSKTRSVRAFNYRGLKYVVLRRDIGKYYEGTLVIKTRQGYRIIPGYPHIRRAVILSKALSRHFIDKVVVEEKMNGYNVRVFMIDNDIYAATRGGYICPYTTHKIRWKYEAALVSLLESLGENAIIVGEAVGPGNPYTRYYYPEAGEWDFFVFDIYVHDTPIHIDKRVQLVESHGLRNVRRLGLVDKHDSKTVLSIVEELDKEKREGVVMKDPYNRVPPLKYTTSYINIDDIRIGMRAPFDEGRHFIFPRLLRELFYYYERKYETNEIREKARRLGEALLLPAMESIHRFKEEGGVGEEFELVFNDYAYVEEFIEYMFRLGVDFSVISIEKQGHNIVFRGVKWMRETQANYARIFETGLSPMD
jgi:putative ATP-dependent DNA ligase